jgi:CobQ-like glutamine amidotransferase family enzyme
MTDLLSIKIELRKIKEILKRGDQRKLALRMGVHPNKVSDGFDGFSSDIKFLGGLQAKAQELIRENEHQSALT